LAEIKSSLKSIENTVIRIKKTALEAVFKIAVKLDLMVPETGLEPVRSH
jgi:hypothetical protein